MGIDRGEILLDDECELVDFSRPIVEQRFPLSHCDSNTASAPQSGNGEIPPRIPSNLHCASRSSFSIVPVMDFPICAAFLANSDLAPFLPPVTWPLGDPFAALRCASDNRDCR